LIFCACNCVFESLLFRACIARFLMLTTTHTPSQILATVGALAAFTVGVADVGVLAAYGKKKTA
jgi:hypothetical protein